ncbi:LamG-like jellyroll fold domain-containing protein [Pseudomonadota bacterium]
MFETKGAQAVVCVCNQTGSGQQEERDGTVMEYLSKWIYTAWAIVKPLFSCKTPGTFILVPVFFVTGTGYVTSTVSDQQSNELSSDSYVDSVWVGEANRLEKISDSEGDTLLAVSGLGSQIISIDHLRGRVWSYGNGILSAVNFDGTQIVSVSIKSHSDHKDKKEKKDKKDDDGHIAMAVDPLGGSVWLSFNKNLLHLSSNGTILSSHSLVHNVVQIAFAAEERRLWVATQKNLVVYDENGGGKLSIDLEKYADVRALALDPVNGGAWVAKKKSVDRFNSNGSLGVSLRLDKIEYLATDRIGNLWAADKKSVFRIDGASLATLFWMEPFNGKGTIDAIAAHPRDGSLWVASNKNLVHIGPDSIFLGDGRVKKKIRNIDVYADIFPPTLKFAAPDEGATLNINQPTVELSFADIGAGIDTETLIINLDNDELEVSCSFDESTGSCQIVADLPEGFVTLSTIISDLSGNVSDPAELDIVIDTIAPEITVESPISGSFTNELGLKVIGHLSEAASLTISDQKVQIGVNHEFTFGPMTLEEGLNSIEIVATDDAGNVGELSLSITLDTVVPEDPNEELIEIEDLGNETLGIIGQPNSVEGGASIMISNPRTGASVSITANADGSFNGQISGRFGDSIAIQIRDNAGNSSNSIIKLTSVPPVLGQVGNFTVPVGSTLTLQLTATDPNDEQLVFGAAPLPLPGNATLNARTGTFSFRPTTAEVGTHTVTFFVSDGVHTITETVTLTVPNPDVSANTTFSGRLLDANNYAQGITTPIVGATISFLNTTASTLSDNNGFFTVTGLPAGSQVLFIDSTTANATPGGGSYASFSESTPLQANVNNIVERPFFLPRIDANSLTVVDPNQTTLVVNQNLGVSFEIPPHTAKNIDGSDFTGTMSISEVPPGLTPVQLPDFLEPGLLVTIQPLGVTFSNPVPISSSNPNGFSEGNEVDLWSLNPSTGEFTIVGIGQVQANGTIITTSGGVRAADWHCLDCPPQLTGSNMADNENCNCGDSTKVSSSVNTRSGWLGSEFALPDYQSLGRSRGLSFVYRSERADPRPIVPFNVTIPVRSAVPITISYQATIGGLNPGQETHVSTTGLSENVDESIRASAQINASQLPTGVYPNNIRVSSNFSRSRISNSIQSDVTVVNGIDSAFGAGWGIAGLTRLHVEGGSNVLMTNGSGQFRRYERAALVPQSGIGTLGHALRFDGSNDRAQTGSTVNLNRLPLTLEAWVRPELRTDGTSSSGLEFPNNIISNDQPRFAGHGFGLNLKQDSAVLVVETQGGATFYQTPVNVNPNEWHHIAVVYTTGRFIAYLDGQVVDQRTYTQAALDGVNFMRVGFHNDDTGAYGTRRLFKGPIDEVRVWNTARTKAQINSAMHASLDGNESGLLMYYPMQDGSGSVVNNQAGSDLNLALFSGSSAPTWVALNEGAEGDFRTLEGDFATLQQDADGTFRRTLKNGTQYRYDSNGLQTQVVDRNGNSTTYEYDGSQNLTSITDPVGKVTTLNYAGNFLSAVIDPVGRITNFIHDGDGNLNQVIFPDGSSKSFGYDQRHLMTTETDERGFVSQRTFDFAGRFQRGIRADGSTRSMINMKTKGLVDISSGQGTISNPAPIVRPSAAVSTYTDGNGHISMKETDGFGNLIRSTDANGLTTTIDRLSGSTATLQGGATFASGKLGLAFDLGKTGDSVGFGDGVGNFGTSDFTVSFWIRSQPGQGGSLINKREICGHHSFWDIRMAVTGRLVVEVDQNTSATNYLAFYNQRPVNDGQYHHVVLTREGTSVSLYIDGLLDGSGNSNGVTNLSNSAPVLVGQNVCIGHDSTRELAGQLDDLGIYQRALNSSQILSLFNNGNLGIVESLQGLIAYWPADGNVSNVVKAHGLPTRLTRPDGSVQTKSYDENGNLITAKELFNGATTTNTYDSTFNFLTSTTDPRGNKTTLNRNAQGNVIERINHLGHKTVLEYDDQGLLTKTNDPNGLVTTFVYNTSGLLETKTETPPASGGATRVSTFTYDGAGQLTQTQRPDGVTVTMTYDLRGRLLTVIDNLGQKVELIYDAAGNRVRTNTVDPDGTLVTTAQQAYDQLNRTTEVAQPHTQTVNSTSQFGYDADGNLLNQTDPNGNVGSKVYDPGDRLIQDIDALSGVTAFEYDANNNLDKVTAPNGTVTDYIVDSIGRRIQEISADRGESTSDYDLANNLTQVVDARGIQANLTYDDLNRVTQIQYPDSSENVTLAYDTCTFGKGRLCSRTDESGGYNFIYDVYGNLVQQDYLTEGNTHTTNYQYDEGHNVIGIILPSGREVTYARDSLKRISAIGAVVNGAPSSIVSNVSYRADGAVTNRNYGNGLIESRAYGLQSRLSQQTISTVDQILYSYDLNGNVLSRDTQSDGHGYAYDELDRLIDDNFNGLQTAYNYDPNHNRLGETTNNSTIQYNIESNTNRLTGIDAATLQYDAAGHLLDDGQGRSFDYNDAGRVFQVYDSGNMVATYVYNALGQRKKKITATETRLYHYDQSGNLLGESTNTGNVIRDYVWQDGTPVAQIDALNSDSLTYLHTDHLATPRLGTNSVGQIIWRWEAKAFGNTMPEEDVDGDTLPTIVNLRFPGQYYDDESGLYFNWYRYYDPNTGRYITSDPIGITGGLNTYGYVEQNPTRFFDPNGLIKWRGSVTALGVIYGGGAQRFVFDLTSECKGGKQATVEVVAGGFSVGFGAEFAGTTGNIEFGDNLNHVDPFVFEGRALYTGIGYAFIGIGYSAYAFELNGARSIGHGYQMGWDASVYGGAGISRLSKEPIVKECGCSE